MNSLIKKICAAFIAITTMSTAVAITQPNQSVVYAKKRKKTINIKSVSLNKKNITVNKGKTYKLVAKINPSHTTKSKRIELSGYFDNFDKLKNMLGGKNYGAVGDYGCWVQSKTINYGRYPIKHQREKRVVDEIQLEDNKYTLFGLYIGMNKNQAMNVVKSKGWKFKKQSASFCDYTKGNKTLCFESKNNKLTSIGFYTSPNYY